MSGNSRSPMVQLLTEDGTRVEHPDYAFDGDDQMIKGFLRDMMLTRRVDVEGTALQRHGELGLWAPCTGQEATQVGAAHGTRRQDMIFPAFREHGMAWVRGIDPLQMLTFFRGTASGVGWDMAEKNFQMYTVIIGAHALHGVGYALAQKKDGLVGNPDPDDNAATMVVVGDGAMSQGDVNEAFVFANSYNTPTVFLCSNNQWAISEPVSLQSKIPMYQRAAGFGMPGVQVDGNDVLAMYAVTQRMMERARSGQGPALIEAVTYRMGAHTTSDDPTKYRNPDEVEVWKGRDPIERVKRYLLQRDVIDDAWLDEIEREADDLGEHMRSGCHALPEPTMTGMFDNVFVEPTTHLQRQRQRYSDYAASFVPEGQN